MLFQALIENFELILKLLYLKQINFVNYNIVKHYFCRQESVYRISRTKQGFYNISKMGSPVCRKNIIRSNAIVDRVVFKLVIHCAMPLLVLLLRQRTNFVILFLHLQTSRIFTYV